MLKPAGSGEKPEEVFTIIPNNLIPGSGNDMIITTVAPAGEIAWRTGRLQDAMAKKNMDGVLIQQKSDLFYFAATGQQGYLYVPVEGNPLLMVVKDFERAETESPIDDIVSLTSIKKIPRVLTDFGLPTPERLGLELDVLPANLYFQQQKIFSDSELVDISTEIRLLRGIKSQYEIEKIRLSCQLSDKLAERMSELLEPGRREVELAGELEAYARKLGHQGIVRMRMWGAELFYGHLLSGPAAAVSSYLASPTGGKGVSPFVAQGAGYNRIKKNEPVLFDYVFAVDGYLSDHARIFSIGKTCDKILDAHKAMLEIQNAVIEKGTPGTVTGELYEVMVSMAEKLGYSKNFMGVGERRIRFTGHGVGLELDEFPFIAKGQQLPLEKGMIIALEPKTIFPGLGVAGIENTHLVTEKGLEPLTTFPDEICQVPSAAK
jgi:Xaa-Pro aminopeptidase